jgi:hypothetical protein
MSLGAEEEFPLLTRSGAVKFVNDELGIPLKKSTFDKGDEEGDAAACRLLRQAGASHAQEHPRMGTDYAVL